MGISLTSFPHHHTGIEIKTILKVQGNHLVDIMTLLAGYLEDTYNS